MAKKNGIEPQIPAFMNTDQWNNGKIIGFSVLLFLSMTVQTGRMALILCALALVLSIGKTPLKNFKARFCLPVLGLVLFALMNAIAAIASPFEGSAVTEFYKFIAALSMAVILLARFESRHVRGLLWGFGAVCALIALLCIDIGTARILFAPFNALVQALGGDFSSALAGSEGNRVNGIYNNANITGALLGMIIPVLLYLVRTAGALWKKVLACVLSGACAVSLLIAMSRGAILCTGLSLLVYLLAEEKGERLSLFFRMLSLGIALAVTGVPAMMYMTDGSIVPLVLAILCGCVFFLLDALAGQRLARRLSGHGVAIAAGAGVLAAALCVVGVLAFRITDPHVFDGANRLVRGLTGLPAGEYTVSGDWDGGETTSVVVYAQTKEDALMGRTQTLYRRDVLDACSFTVPEGMETVFFAFSGEKGSQLREVTLSDGTQIPLAYRFVPESIATRLQGNLLYSTSVLLRLQFLKDAWTLFTGAPLTGYGLGSTEGMYPAVQPFAYESLYVHNHILQVMSDMGLLGLAGFLALLLGVGWLLLRALRGETRSLAAALLAAWVMMNTHSLMEINFSVRAFQIAAFVLLTLGIVLYAEPLRSGSFRSAGLVLNAALCLYLAVFGGLLLSHRMVDRESAEFSTSDANEFLDTLESYVRRDVFVREQNQLSYVSTALAYGGEEHVATVQKYVADLRNAGTYTACSGLAEYFYLPLGDHAQMFETSREAVAAQASRADAWDLQVEFYRTAVLPAMGAENVTAFVDGVLALRDTLTEYNQGRLEEIVLTEENQLFVEAAATVREESLPADAAYLMLTALSQAPSSEG